MRKTLGSFAGLFRLEVLRPKLLSKSQTVYTIGTALLICIFDDDSNFKILLSYMPFSLLIARLKASRTEHESPQEIWSNVNVKAMFSYPR